MTNTYHVNTGDHGRVPLLPPVHEAGPSEADETDEGGDIQVPAVETGQGQGGLTTEGKSE